MSERICYGCMQPMEKDSCSCGWQYDYSQEERETLLPPGTLLNFGKYRIGRSLGRGGFGITYIGVQQGELGLKVAVKEYYPKKIACRNTSFSMDLMPLYRPGMSEQDQNSINQRYSDGKRKYIEEAKRLVQLNELSTIVSVLDYFEENNTAYIVMEYIDGIDLYKHMHINSRTMTMPEVETYIYPVIQDLGKVHQKGIIHRDISPDNIMVTRSGTVKLIDFGASVNQESEEVQALRKNGFAPLEQYNTTNVDLGPWTDVYAMCATIYYLLSGMMIPDARDRQFFDRYQTLRSQNIMVPARLDRVLKKGLSIDRKQRYDTMEALLRDLKKVHSSFVGNWMLAGGALALACAGIALRLYGGIQEMPASAVENSSSAYEEGYLQAHAGRQRLEQTDSASDYAVFDDLVYIRYPFEDGTVMLVRAPIGTDDFESVEYVTDGLIDCFCVENNYLYFTMLDDGLLYRADISNIRELPDESQRITAWKQSGSLEKVSEHALDTEYGFTISEGYVYTVIHSADGKHYEILRMAEDGSESQATNLQLSLHNCVFYDGYAYMTVEEGQETVLKRMQLDGSYFEELARYPGEIPAMWVVEDKIYFLLNASDPAEESYLGRISINGTQQEKLSVKTDQDTRYCYMTGVVDGNSVYYTCSVKGTEEVNNLYCYSLTNGSNKQISSECGRYIVTSDEIDTIVFASEDGSEIRQMNKDGSNPHVLRSEDGGTGIDVAVDATSLAIIKDHVYYLDGGNVAYKRIRE